jgi:hypothetical protein
VGAHCSAPGCGQQDFLPFVCPGCSLPMCMEHRAPATHACSRTSIQGSAAGRRDVISVECPLCLNSIKMDRQEDPNSAFEEHLSTSCTKAAAARPSPSTCPAPGCGVRLGPSNAFQCNRCNNRVCMSHRMPEDHSCTSHRNQRAARAAFAATARAQGKEGVATKRAVPEVDRKTSSGATALKYHQSTAAASGTHGNVSNRAHADPRLAVEGSAFQCPMCDKPFTSPDEVARHVEATHLHADVTNSRTISPAPHPPPSHASLAAGGATLDHEVRASLRIESSHIFACFLTFSYLYTRSFALIAE